MAHGNLSAVLRCKNDLRLEDRPVPEPASHEVLIAINTVGICGSDVHYWKSGRIGNFVVEKPMVLGHETSGTVAKVGDKVKDLEIGDRVCIEPGVPCRICEFCKKGRYNICPDVRFCATPPDDGSLCQYYCHAADFCYKLPKNVTLEEGALMEPLSIGVHACRRAGISAGYTVLICGAGPIGLVNLLVAKAMGATRICITDICENRLELAKNLGATQSVCVESKTTEDSVLEIKAKTGRSPDVAIECSGAASSIKLAVLATKPGGVVVQIGHGIPEVPIPIVDVTVREIDIKGVFRYANSYPAALDLVASGTVDVKPLITHRFTLKETLKAFETAHNRDGGAIKVLINCT